MDRYIGTKIVLAEPMKKGEFVWAQADRVPPAIKQTDGPDGYKVVYEDGYVSWSPKETFERAYRKITPEEAGLIVTGQNPGRVSQG